MHLKTVCIYIKTLPNVKTLKGFQEGGDSKAGAQQC